jgi:GNAT superfamily N-acetyltransferase
VPTALLARMGVDHSLQGQGIGKALVANAVSRSLAATENIAAFALMANAKPQSQSFYKRLGFLESPKDPSLMILPLVID